MSPLGRVVRRTYQNAGLLLSGEVVSGAIGLINLAIAARLLGPVDFGVLVLVHTYVVVIGALTRFQSWQALIRYGSEVLQRQKPREFQRLILFTTYLDAGSGVVAILVAYVTAPWMAGWLGWNTEVIPYAMVYSLAAPFLTQATPNGVLWLFDRFRLQALLVNVAPMIRLIGSLALLVVGGDLSSLILVWLAAALGHGILVWLAGAVTLAKDELLPLRLTAVTGIGRTHSGIWSYVISTNLSSSVKAARNRVAVLLIAALLGPAAGGFYRLAQDIASVLTRAGLVINQSIFPELTKLQASGDHDVMESTVLWSGLIAGLGSVPFVLLAWIGAEELLVLIAGQEFLDGAVLVPLVVTAGAVLLFGNALAPALLAMGAARRTLAAQLVMAVIQFVALWLWTPVLGLAGAGYALLAANSVYVAVLSAMYLYITKRPGRNRGSA